NMENNIQTAFANMDKVPYDSRGISLMEGQATTTLRRAFTNGIIAQDDNGSPLYTVTTKSRTEVPPEERANR
ncbi:hypothetical protein, partial [Acinetobacter baumannii]|uniref:hypothetical protein n=1 Tax=Acinetobacter baumannii TaxID=470 RepID=UPI000AB2C737